MEDQRHRWPAGPRGDLQHALLRVLRSLVFRGEPDTPLNELPISQLKCLYIVKESEGQKMQDIAHRMEIGLPAVSQIVDRLVRRGHLERQPDPLDRRVVRVILTPAAKGLMEEADRHRQKRMEATLDLLDAKSLADATHGFELLALAAERVEAAEKASQASDEMFGPSQDSLRVASDPLVELISERARSRRKRTQPEVLPGAEAGSR